MIQLRRTPSGKSFYWEYFIGGLLFAILSLVHILLPEDPEYIKNIQQIKLAYPIFLIIGLIVSIFSARGLLIHRHDKSLLYTEEDFEKALADLRKMYFKEHGRYPDKAEESTLWPELFATQEKKSGFQAGSQKAEKLISLPDGFTIYLDEPIPTQNVNANETRNIHCENSAGEIIWRVKTSFDTSESGPFTGLWLENDVLKAQRQDGWVYNIDPKTGEGVLYLRTPC